MASLDCAILEFYEEAHILLSASISVSVTSGNQNRAGSSIFTEEFIIISYKFLMSTFNTVTRELNCRRYNNTLTLQLNPSMLCSEAFAKKEIAEDDVEF